MNPKDKARKLQQEFFDTINKMKGPRFDSDIADSAGISRPLYSMMKSGKKPMSLNSMIRIARVFDMKVNLTLK